VEPAGPALKAVSPRKETRAGSENISVLRLTAGASFCFELDFLEDHFKGERNRTGRAHDLTLPAPVAFNALRHLDAAIRQCEAVATAYRYAQPAGVASCPVYAGIISQSSLSINASMLAANRNRCL